MAHRYPSHTILGLVLTFVACSSAVYAQISPPAGPIGRTRPTIVTGPAPIINDQPGSYILGGNLVTTGAVNGIEISASHVTLNLDGGVVDGAHVGLAGIKVIGTQSNLYIHNGIVTGWTNRGIDASSASKSQYDRLRIDSNGSTVSHEGLRTGNESLVTHCVSSSNAGSGIRTGRSSVVQACIASGNGSLGISVSHESIMRNCTAEGNAGTGIVAGNKCVISHCSAVANTTGISGSGFGLIEHCTVSGNSGTGISGSANGTITNCVVSGGTKGISASARISILGNTISAVNGPGIYLNFKHNHVEGNTIGSCVNGIQTDSGTATPGTENLIIRNVVRGSTGTGSPSANYDIIANNSYAQIINIAASAGFISTDPNANLER